jgi:hypothetical protein
MKHALSKTSAAAAVALFAASASAAPIIVSFTPSAQHVNVGDALSVEVHISGLDAEILSGFDLNFRYNSALLQWSVVDGSTTFAQLGGAWGVDPIFEYDSVVNGDIGVQASSLDDDANVAANQADSFLLFRFDFTATADGTTQFGLGPSLDFERNFLGLEALSLDVQVGSACIAVGQGNCVRRVPEPASFGLAGMALIGAGLPWLSQRRRRTVVTA